MLPKVLPSKCELHQERYLEARGYQDGQNPSIQKVESGFKWTTAFKDQYSRVKAAMHEVSGLPQVVPQELNFGGLNGDALQVLFHDIISDTEEHWIAWEYGLQELHEKSIKYLQARTTDGAFSYDSKVVNSIIDYHTEMKFVLPLPDNRKELVTLLSDEMIGKLESQAGAMRRLGVEDVKAKQQEIANEQAQLMGALDPYAAEGGVVPPAGAPVGKTELLKQAEANGMKDPVTQEPVQTCPTCNGSGQTIDRVSGEYKECSNCRGDGLVQVRKR